ncbi:hypothetical protein ACFLQY_02895 [Verrucomicrobiota bacterium]
MMKRRMMICALVALVFGLVGGVQAKEEVPLTHFDLARVMANAAGIEIGVKTMVQLAAELTEEGIAPLGGWNVIENPVAKIGDLVVTVLQVTGNADKVTGDAAGLAKAAKEVLGMDVEDTCVPKDLTSGRAWELMNTPELKGKGLAMNFATPD